MRNKRIFIDGRYGTTGLEIFDRLKDRTDIDLLMIPYELRHNETMRRQMLNEADLVFLCLPDDAAEESVSMIEEDRVVVIDTSTRHRTEPGWVYGLMELEGQKEKIRKAKRIANPGCHATGFITLVQPLVKAGIIRPETALQCFSLTGYSGGGKKMMAQYEAEDPDPLLFGPRLYALNQNHKHLKEMKIISGLDHEPIFCPIVADYYSGMETVVPLLGSEIQGTMESIKEVYRNTYSSGMIHLCEEDEEGGYRSAIAYQGRDDLEISVCGNEERILLISRFDNLGKGACGAAIQNMNLVMGLKETEGLRTGGIQ